MFTLKSFSISSALTSFWRFKFMKCPTYHSGNTILWWLHRPFPMSHPNLFPKLASNSFWMSWGLESSTWPTCDIINNGWTCTVLSHRGYISSHAQKNANSSFDSLCLLLSCLNTLSGDLGPSLPIHQPQPTIMFNNMVYLCSQHNI